MQQTAVVIPFPQAKRGTTDSPPSRRPPVRLTRRGRLVALTLLLALAAAVLVLLAPASRAADPTAPRPTAVVQPGDTLWDITTRHSSGRDPFRVIEEIRRLNELPGYTVYAGQELTLPNNR
jgi:LysM repeat protein